MWDAEENLTGDWVTMGSNSSRLSCPMGKSKDKSFQLNIVMKPNGSKSGKFEGVNSVPYTAGELTNVGYKYRWIPMNVGIGNFSFLWYIMVK